jgi:hypothetical protein
VPAQGITGYPRKEVIARAAYDFRNFGYFLPFKAGESADDTKKRRDEVRIMSRTVNESAEAARVLNQDLMPKIYGGKLFPNPGLKCEGTKEPAALHADLWDCVVTKAEGDFDTCKAKVCKAN